MRLFDRKLNMVNLIAIPLLIGINVDYGIYLVSLARRTAADGTDLIAGIGSSAHAVTISAVSTILGFSSLTPTSVPAIRSLGWVMAVGVGAGLFATLFLLAPLLIRRAAAAAKVAAAAPAAPAARSLILLVGLLWCSTGCTPRERLSFPEQPLMRSGDTTWFDVNRNGKPDFAIAPDAGGRIEVLSYDDDEDGRADRLYRLSDYADDSVPHVLLLLDSVPYEVVAERYRGGGLRLFGSPQKVIPPFPSLTEVCYTSVLRAPPLAGMIDQHYDPRDGKIQDGMWARVKGYRQPWEQRLHYGARFWEGGLSFLDPREWYAGELERARRAVDASPDHVTIVYVWSAASMACKYGRAGVDETLDGAERLCLQLLYERRGAVKISMMSDHGHNLVASKNVPVERLLRDQGLRPTKRLRQQHPDDVVLELNGLVTYFAAHTSQPQRIADAMLRDPQIELAMYMDGNQVIVRDGHGAAAIERRGARLRYVSADRDVLGYQSLLDGMSASGKVDADGFIADADWFDATLDHEYPDAPRRIWDAFHGGAVNVPDVMFTVRDGFCAGLPQFEKYITMASTHGGLNQANSATFVMTMMRNRVVRPMRAGEVLDALEPGYDPPIQVR
jgi:hypothetical protein